MTYNRHSGGRGRPFALPFWLLAKTRSAAIKVTFRYATAEITATPI